MKNYTHLNTTVGVPNIHTTNISGIIDYLTGDIYNKDLDIKEEYIKEMNTLEELYKKSKTDKDFEDKYRDAKKSIPCFIVGSLYDTEKAIEAKGYHSVAGEFINHYNYSLMIDIDEKDQDTTYDLETVFNSLKDDKYTYLIFRSPSKAGLKILIDLSIQDLEVDVTENFEMYKEFHKLAYDKLETYFKTTYNLITDKQCSDINRKCLYSYDPKYYLSTTSKKFSVGKLPLKKMLIKTEDKIIRNRVEYAKNNGENYYINKIYNFCTEKHISLTNTYDDWIHLGWCLIANSDTKEQALKYFINFSRMDSTYSESVTKKKFKELVETMDNSFNYSLKKYINELVEYGYELDNNEKKTSKYKKSELRDIFYLLELNNCQDEMTGHRYVNLKHITGEDKLTYLDDALELTVFNYINEKYYKEKLLKNDFRDMFDDSRYIKKINFFIEEIKKHETEDGSDFNKYVDGIHTHNDFLSKQYLTYWMMGVFRNVIEHRPFKYILIYAGGQNIGKTYNVELNLLKNFAEYTTTTFSWKNDKDEQLKLVENIFILDDELNASTKADIEQIKKTTSMTAINIRASYARKSQIRKRVANFISTTNEEEIFSDLTGGVRFFVLDIKSLDSQKHFDNIDYDKLWGYVYHNRKRWHKYL